MEDTDAAGVEPPDPLMAWHVAVGSRSEMRLLEFEWDAAEEIHRRPYQGAFPKPVRIRWSSAKTGVTYLSTLSDGWLKTRAMAPPADFSADVWQGYNYMTPTEVLQAIINRVRDYGHAL